MHYLLTELFEYDELSDQAKDRARREHSKMLSECDNRVEDVRKHFEISLEKIGFPKEDIDFSLGYQHSDGMAFYGRIEFSNIENILKYADQDELAHNWKTLYDAGEVNDVCFNISRKSLGLHYSHYNTMLLTSDSPPCCKFIILKITSAISDVIKAVSKKLEADRYKLLETRKTKSYIEESIRTTECLFKKSGEPTGLRIYSNETFLKEGTNIKCDYCHCMKFTKTKKDVISCNNCEATYKVKTYHSMEVR